MREQLAQSCVYFTSTVMKQKDEKVNAKARINEHFLSLTSKKIETLFVFVIF